MTDHFTWLTWTLAALAAVCIGMSKTGFGGVALVSVALMASILPPRQSVGVVLPLLIFADCFAVQSFRQHARWKEIWSVLPPALIGVVLGALLLHVLNGVDAHPDLIFKRLVGGIILVLAVLQCARMLRPRWFAAGAQPSAGWNAWQMGILAGVTSMLANSAGPIMALYLLALGLPKLELVGTRAWIFLTLNLSKVPFNFELGLIDTATLRLNLYLLPAVAAGVFVGRALLQVVSETLFQTLLLVFAVVASMRLLLS